MTVIDWLIVAFAAALIPVGYRQGLIVGALSLAGFAAGAFLGARVGPLVLADGSASPYAPLTALIGGLLLGGVLAVLFEGAGVALRRRLIRGPAPRTVDGVGGAAVLVLLALAISWVLGAVALNTPGLREVREDIQRSAILGALNDALPPSGPILNVLNRIDPTPRLRGPSAEVDAPKRRILRDPDVRSASAAVVRVMGTACGLNVSGSGWVAAPQTVVTNAHVIAGEEDTRIETQDGSSLEATPIAYRPRDDLAVLRVEGLGLEPIPLADDPATGSAAAVAGFPGSGEFTLAPARLGTTGQVRSQDSYGRGPIDRSMTSFRGRVQGGNSGGPLIGADGRVLTTVFAATLSSERSEGLGVPNEITRKVLAKAGGRVGTGPCAR